MKVYLKSTLILLAVALMSMQTVKPKRVVFFGDSITWHGQDPDGFISLLKNKLKAKNLADQYELIGAGVSGNKIYDLYFRMDKDVLEKKPDVVYIYIGVNDVWHKTLNGTGTEVGRFEKCYSLIIEKIQKSGARVILCTPAVIGEKKGFTNEQDGDMNLYAQVVGDLAVKYKCDLINLRKTFLDYEEKNNPKNDEKGILTRDKVHLTPTGNQIVSDLMYDQLVK
jgi:lysophospholipase L1-like esterase